MQLIKLLVPTLIIFLLGLWIGYEIGFREKVSSEKKNLLLNLSFHVSDYNLLEAKEESDNPKGVVITQPSVGVATPTLGKLTKWPTLKGLNSMNDKLFNPFRVERCMA